MGQVRRITMLALALLLVGAPTAGATFRVSTLYGVGGGRAQWIDTGDPPPGVSDTSVMELFVGGTSGGGFDSGAVVRFTGTGTGVGSAMPASSPTYLYRTSESGPSGGSPRLTLRLSNGGGELQPTSVSANQWASMDGQSGWDTYGGSCGYRSGLSYAQLLECHPTETVVGVEIWNDSGWLYQGGYQVLIDNVTYNGETVSNQDVNAITNLVEGAPLGPSVAVSPEEGTVLVRLPDYLGSGRFVPLSEVTDIPYGSVVDTTQGEVELQSDLQSIGVTQSGTFSDGIFRIVAPLAPEDAGITELRLRGELGPCPAPEASTAALVRRFRSDVRRRRLRSSGSSAAATPTAPTSGFRVRAKYSSATAQDAAWTTFDRCDGTFTRVTRGRVVVNDLHPRRSGKRFFVLRAGGGHLARP